MQLKNIFLAAILVAAPRLSATVITYGGALSGSNENPTVITPGTGFAVVTIDDVLNTMHLVI